jgi:hypothetical protein
MAGPRRMMARHPKFADPKREGVPFKGIQSVKFEILAPALFKKLKTAETIYFEKQWNISPRCIYGIRS